MKQTKLSLGPPQAANGSRPPLAPLSENRKRTASPLASARPSQAPRIDPPIPAESALSPTPKTQHWVEEIAPRRWAAALDRLIKGYADKSGFSYPPATTNLIGCLLAQKGPNRVENGYIQVLICQTFEMKTEPF